MTTTFAALVACTYALDGSCWRPAHWRAELRHRDVTSEISVSVCHVHAEELRGRAGWTLTALERRP